MICMTCVSPALINRLYITQITRAAHIHEQVCVLGVCSLRPRTIPASSTAIIAALYQRFQF